MRARRMIDHVVCAQIDDIGCRISAWFGNVHGFVSFLFAIVGNASNAATPIADRIIPPSRHNPPGGRLQGELAHMLVSKSAEPASLQAGGAAFIGPTTEAPRCTKPIRALWHQ
jgi:hypothetical protein